MVKLMFIAGVKKVLPLFSFGNLKSNRESSLVLKLAILWRTRISMHCWRGL